MSDNEQVAPGAPEATSLSAEDLKNLKSEVTRKTENLKSEMDVLKAQNARLLELVSANQPAPKAAPTEDLSDLFYKDPEAYTRAVEARVKNSMRQEMSQANAVQQKQARVIQQIAKEFPEATDESHPLYKRAVEIYANELDEDDKSSPAAYKLAINQAALEMGVKPKSQRKQDDEEPSVGSSSSYSRGDRKRSPKISAETMQWAELLGLDATDPKVKERLEKRAGRDWSKYRGVK